MQNVSELNREVNIFLLDLCVYAVTNTIYSAKIFKGTYVFFIPHPTGLIQLFVLKFRLKQRSGRMLYTTASKHLQKS